MNKKIAIEIADDALKKTMWGDKAEVKARVIDLLTEAEHYFIEKNKIEYQVRIDAFYDDGRKRDAIRKKKIIRVVAAVDDISFWSAVSPLSRSTFVNEDSGEEVDDYYNEAEDN